MAQGAGRKAQVNSSSPNEQRLWSPGVPHFLSPLPYPFNITIYVGALLFQSPGTMLDLKSQPLWRNGLGTTTPVRSWDSREAPGREKQVLTWWAFSKSQELLVSKTGSYVCNVLRSGKNTGYLKNARFGKAQAYFLSQS